MRSSTVSRNIARPKNWLKWNVSPITDQECSSISWYNNVTIKSLEIFYGTAKRELLVEIYFFEVLKLLETQKRATSAAIAPLPVGVKSIVCVMHTPERKKRQVGVTWHWPNRDWTQWNNYFHYDYPNAASRFPRNKHRTGSCDKASTNTRWLFQNEICRTWFSQMTHFQHKDTECRKNFPTSWR